MAGARVSHGWEERGRQLALVAEDKLRLLSLAKSKISAIIRNITTEIWSDVGELKTGVSPPFFFLFQSVNTAFSQRSENSQHVSKVNYLTECLPAERGIIENDFSSVVLVFAARWNLSSPLFHFN